MGVLRDSYGFIDITLSHSPNVYCTGNSTEIQPPCISLHHRRGIRERIKYLLARDHATAKPTDQRAPATRLSCVAVAVQLILCSVPIGSSCSERSARLKILKGAA